MLHNELHRKIRGASATVDLSRVKCGSGQILLGGCHFVLALV